MGNKRLARIFQFFPVLRRPPPHHTLVCFIGALCGSIEMSRSYRRLEKLAVEMKEWSGQGQQSSLEKWIQRVVCRNY